MLPGLTARLERYSALKLLVLGGGALFFARYFFTTGDIMSAFLHSFTLVLHEAGHLFMAPFGALMGILGGTLWQIVLPISFSLYFALTGQRFSASLTLFLVSFSLLDASVYVADARARQLPLLGGDPASHDWWNLLGLLGLLEYDKFIAGLFYAEGAGFYLLALYMGLRTARKSVSS